MNLPKEFVNLVLTSSPEKAWAEIQNYLYSIFSQTFSSSDVQAEISNRDREINELELLLSHSAWELWKEMTSVKKTSDSLKEFWAQPFSSKCILILDGLSLRELPFFLTEAAKYNLSIQAKMTLAEVPPDTDSFARRLGYSSRSALANNSTKNPFFKDAFTESANFPWKDCIPLIQSRKDILFWHHFPDILIHSFDNPGEGIDKLSKKVSQDFRSEDFWEFIQVLAQGRKLIITSDHGYAATGLFPDVKNPDQVQYLKTNYKSQRYSKEVSENFFNIPPLDLSLPTQAGNVKLILGRYKWKSAGGYPTLSHGGLSLLEMFVPYMEIG